MRIGGFECNSVGAAWSHLEVGEEGDVASPLDGGEKQSRRQLADVVDAHDVVGLHALTIPRRGVGFGSEQQGDVAGQVRVAVEARSRRRSRRRRVAVGESELPRQTRGLRRRNPPPLHCCKHKQITHQHR